jgi:hypothetical protein
MSAVKAQPSTLLDRVERALAIDDPAVLRLGAAGTSITFVVAGARQENVTLLLDREPPEIGPNGAGEVVVELDELQAEAFSRGRLVLSISLLDGEVAFSGPARKYLAVDPILRGLLARVDRGEA